MIHTSQLSVGLLDRFGACILRHSKRIVMTGHVGQIGLVAGLFSTLDDERGLVVAEASTAEFRNCVCVGLCCG